MAVIFILLRLLCFPLLKVGGLTESHEEGRPALASLPTLHIFHSLSLALRVWDLGGRANISRSPVNCQPPRVDLGTWKLQANESAKHGTLLCL